MKKKSWRHRLHEIIYEADTPAGKSFDLILLIFILLSVILVALESVDWIDQEYHSVLDVAEWFITILFTIEYLLRLISIKKPSVYIFSFYGIIDLVSTLPKYLSLFFFGTQSLVTLRALRLLRIFRILKLTRYIGESNSLAKAMSASKTKTLPYGNDVYTKECKQTICKIFEKDDLDIIPMMSGTASNSLALSSFLYNTNHIQTPSILSP